MSTVARVVLCCLLVVLAGCSGTGVAPGGTETTVGDPETPTEAGTGTAGAGDGDPTTTLDPGANGTLAVHFINVGQGAAALVVSPSGETMLVDTGDYEDDGEHVVAYLRRHGIARIDHLVTTHADADHIGGHAAVIEYLETEGDGVGAVYDPGIASSSRTYEAYLDAVERHDVPLYETRAGDDLPLSGVDCAVLAPPEEFLAGEDRNENSIVLRVGHGATAVLLTGDAGEAAERWLVDRYGDGLDAAVLQAAHHGAADSTSDPFLDAVSPSVAVVSSAYDSQYGHPHEEVLDRLSERSIPTFWTATHGTVVARSDGRRVTVASQRPAPTDARTVRSGDAVPLDATDAVEPRLSVEAGSDPVAVDGPSDGEAEEGGEGGATDADANGAAPDGDATVAADGGTEAPGAPADLRVAEVHADAAGPDGENLNDEYVVFENAGDAPLDLSGWTVRDGAGHEYEFGDVELAPGERVTLHTGSGTDDGAAVYWGAGRPIWNNDGDAVVVETANGERVLTERYD